MVSGAQLGDPGPGTGSEVWIQLAVLAAAVASVLLAWWSWRKQQSTQRRGVLAGVLAELRLHEGWVGTPYQMGCWPLPDDPHGWWGRERLMTGRDHVPLVHKLSTVATDTAIQGGPALFINPQLVDTLVGSRQRVGQLNQLIDNAMAFQSLLSCGRGGGGDAGPAPTCGLTSPR